MCQNGADQNRGQTVQRLIVPKRSPKMLGFALPEEIHDEQRDAASFVGSRGEIDSVDAVDAEIDDLAQSEFPRRRGKQL
jgi:hypothetical protein